MRRSSDGSRSAASAASSAVNPDITSLQDQVLYAGFDKLEKKDGGTRRVLLLGLLSGYQVWDAEETEKVHLISSAHDGQVSFMQMLPNPKDIDDRFSESRPLLAVCEDSSWKDTRNRQSASDNPASETVAPTNVHFYSLRSGSDVHTIRFGSIIFIYTVRCSSRIVAVLQPAQIQCFDAKTLVEKYTIDTNAIVRGSLGVGYGPLAVGPQWIAYSGNRHGLKGNGVTSDNVPDADNKGMVMIQDIMSKGLITEFQAHMGPISALSFDPSGSLLVTASLRGQNLHVFRIIPSASASSLHIFKLQHAFTKAVIQDISFSPDSRWVVISSGGTSRLLFEIDSKGESNAKVPLIRSTNIIGGGSLPGRRNLLVFASSRCMIEYELNANPVGEEVSVKPIRRWSMMQGQHSDKGDGCGQEAAQKSAQTAAQKAALEAAHRLPNSVAEGFEMWQEKGRRHFNVDDFAPQVGAIPAVRLPRALPSDEEQ